jgi:hypothetical protein
MSKSLIFKSKAPSELPNAGISQGALFLAAFEAKKVDE